MLKSTFQTLRPRKMHWLRYGAIGLLFGAFAAPVHSVDLAEVYRAAVDNDPVLGAALASFNASQQRVPQARSALLPNVTVGGNSAWTERSFPTPGFQDTDPTSPTFGQIVDIAKQRFNEHGWQAQVRQPLLDLTSWHAYRSSKSTARSAQADYAATEQLLILRVVQAYLDVLRAQDLLDTTRAQEAAVNRQLEQVQQRFEVGLVAITDVLESQAVFDDAVVQRVQAVGDHDIFFETLTTLTGTPFQRLDRLSDTLPIINPEPGNEADWVTTALASNLEIKAAAATLEAAQRTLRSRRSEHLPTIDTTISQNHFVTGGQNVFGRTGTKTDTTAYAVNISVPVYQGGLVRARTREADALAQQALEQLKDQQRTVSRDTRNLFRSVATGVVRVQARLKAIRSSQSALEATQIGYEVGTRNIVDVLQAQQRLYSSQFDYADSRYNYVIDLMALKRAAGVLSAEDLEALNQFSDAENGVSRLTSLKEQSIDLAPQ